MNEKITVRGLEEKNIRFLSELLNNESIIAALHSERLSYDGWLEVYRKYWKEDTDEKHFIMFFEGTPAGWFKINGLDGKDTACLSMLAIAPEYQRKGLGKAAVSFFEKYISDRGFSSAGIHTTEDNSAAQKLYKKCGYEVTEHFETVTGDGSKMMSYTFFKKFKTEN
ncbi:MAG: GNAT family N-acetyltransferase [Oscillospiraceae bacterium]|nr:GNAT family N-acetyltransferase [Oscillospiraceae bacterium]